MTIRKLSREELENGLSLVWDVFNQYEAASYTAKGKNALYDAIHSKDYLDSLDADGAFYGEKLVVKNPFLL